MSGNDIHEFGGDWTALKLDVISRYLSAYTIALKNQPFKKGYIDAFAGSGYRTPKRKIIKGTDDQMALDFPVLVEDEPQGLLDGSARKALQIEPPFDKYIFIEKDADRCEQLRQLTSEFPDLAVKIDVREGDANTVIQDICSLDWKRHRAVLFLDPYGMQVEWKTIEAIASTGAIDLWILFPLGIGLNRLLTKSGDIPESWRKKIDSLLGTTDWYDEFYEVKVSSNLFGEDEQELVKAKVGKIGEYFVERLRSAFPAVAKKPAVLRNSTNNPLYLLCFAVGSENERAQQIALRIANQLLKDIW